MKGQWIGRYDGDVEGRLMINIDEMKGHYESVAYINPDDTKNLSTVAYLVTEDKAPEQQAVAYLNPVHPRTGFQCRWDEIKDLFPDGTVHSTKATVSLKINNNELTVDAVSEIGTKLKSTLARAADNEQSKIEGRIMSWDDYKTHISELSNLNYLFRGQEKPWRLRTSFHRKGRYRINKFIEKDIKKLHQRLSAKTPHFFDLTVPDQNGAFFNLVQHHGYPTPLLDWSYSPYVAAFFAFRSWQKNYDGDECVRIYLFNNEAWIKRFPQIQNLDPPFPHLSVMEFIAIDNERLVPQQAVTTVTNIDDIEAYILERETETNEQYLQAIDIRAKERDKVMRELSYMGITAGSMFPGLDGVCEELRESNFDS